MLVKRILIFLPIGVTAFLVQSFFWVPTYDEQAKGNPQRLTKYIHGSAADAQILNPILSADTTSSSINDLVFDGLIDLDENLDYRGRLATSWTQHEEAYLSFVPETGKLEKQGRLPVSDANDWARYLLTALRKENPDWYANIESVQVEPAHTVEDRISVPLLDAGGRPLKENDRPQFTEVAYTLEVPIRLKFKLKEINQDFFEPIRRLVGEDYFRTFPYTDFIRAKESSQQPLLKPHYEEILSPTEHNPVLVFQLRKGVLFHDGHEFDAGDVLFTYESIMNPRNASPRKSDYEPIQSVEILNPYKIKFTYKRLFSPAINSWFMGILPEHLLNETALKKEARARGEDGDTFTLRESEFNRHPVGTGAFIFEKWKSDEMIQLVRNEKYWEGPPEFQEYIMRIIPDPLTQEMEFYAGAVDNYSVQPHQVARFKKDDRFQIFSSTGYFYSYIGYNMRNPLFQSRRVRQALGMAIDVEKIIQYVLYGEGERVTGPYPKITDWYDPSVKPLPHDPQGALKILNDLGWHKNEEGWLEKDGKVFEFNLITNSGNPIRKNILTIAQNNWRKLGIRCQTQMFEWAVFLKDFVNALKFDAVVLGWSMGIDPDLYQIWHSSQTGPNQLNFIGYENPEVDRLIIRLRREYDKEEQVPLAHKIHRLIAHDQPYTFLYVAKSTQVLDKKIVIVERKPDGTKEYKKIYPTKDGRIRYYFNQWRKLDHVPEFNAAG